MHDNSPPIYELGEEFYDVVEAASFPEQTLRCRNDRWAQRVGLGDLSDQEWLEHFASFTPLDDNMQEPLALRYHGHQFRSYNPNLGDGRGFLFAQVYDQQDDRLLDLGTKGSGKTPYSRTADGRLTLKGGVREWLATEMLEARGVYTSKTLSLVETGEQLQRHDEPSPTRSCVLVRLGHSHIRFGTFQRYATTQRHDLVMQLVNYCVEHYYPHLEELPEADKVERFFLEVTQRTADLCAQWMVAGFVHGVLNTDNMNINGESFDYGPWRFAPTINPNFTAAYFDQQGLYAYGRQPEACLWNMSRLGECLVPLSNHAALTEIAEQFRDVFLRSLGLRFTQILGVESAGAQKDEELFDAAMNFLVHHQTPYDRFLYDWYGGLESRRRAMAGPCGDSYAGEEFKPFLAALKEHPPVSPQRLEADYFQQDNPLTMVIGYMESLWAPIAEDDDWQPLYDAIRRIRMVGALYGHDPSTQDRWLPSRDWMEGDGG